MAQAILGNPKLKFIKGMFYMAPAPQIVNVGDIAYWDGSSVKTTPLSSWNSSLGNPVGVVMIPSEFLPDKKARIISLTNMIYNGNDDMPWDESNGFWVDSSASNSNWVGASYPPDTETYYESKLGYLPSDKSDWSGASPSTDASSRYYYTNNELLDDSLNWMSIGKSPSPYLSNGRFNPAYSLAFEGGNALSDFNGLFNTQSLVNEGSTFYAAHACWNYKDITNGRDGLQWYLPALGELGFLMPRFQLINQSIQEVGGDPIENYGKYEGYIFWCSTEYYDDEFWGTPGYRVWSLDASNGLITSELEKQTTAKVRCCALLQTA